MIKSPKHSEGMMILLAVAGIGLLYYLITHVMTKSIPDGNREIAIHTLGIVEGVVVTIYSYYFGSSAGSRSKDQKEETKP